jgi:hypothetical protein
VRHYDAPERDLRSRASVWQRVTGYGAKESHWLAVRALARFVDRRWPLAVTAVLSTIGALASGWPDADNSGVDTYQSRREERGCDTQLSSLCQAALGPRRLGTGGSNGSPNTEENPVLALSIDIDRSRRVAKTRQNMQTKAFMPVSLNVGKCVSTKLFSELAIMTSREAGRALV